MVEINTLSRITDKVKQIINNGHDRSVKARKNILISFFIKGISIVLGFIMVPLLLNFLGTVEYGIWITLTSIISWISYFDIGLGNGLRNKFAESLAKQDHMLAKIYVSTTYAALTLIFCIFFLIFMFVSPLIDWSVALNAPKEMAHELDILIKLTVGFFLLRFILKLISIIIMADQRPAVSNTFEPLGNAVSLIGILLLLHFTKPSLINLGIVLGVSPVLVLIIISVYFFNQEYKIYKPSIKHINFQYFKDLAGLGFQFFIIQVTIVIILSTNNIIITQIVGPEAVTSYNIAFRYFGLISMGFVIIANTYWSAFTEAYIKNDIEWIKKITRALIRIFIGIIALLFFMLIFSDEFYRLWVGEKVRVPFMLSLYSALFVLISVWASIFTYFINGTGKIKVQLYTTVISALISIPVSIYLAKTMNMGASGVVLGSCLAYIPHALISPIQYLKIITKKDRGIWGR
ncbi:MAG TPA: oligosaccharide flippase family protein [Lentimicrobium sp.]|nr:oligosaccharide flippase family protein [Lentimicrobium sp.]